MYAVLVTLTRIDSVKFCSVKGVYDTVSMVGACTHAAHVRPPGPPAVQAPAATSICMPPAAVSAGLRAGACTGVVHCSCYLSTANAAGITLPKR